MTTNLAARPPRAPLAVRTEHRPLRASVEEAVNGYFVDLGGGNTHGVYDMVLEEVEPPLLRAVLRHTRNNQSKAARMLGLSRGTLRKKLKQYGLL
jgi:Fis family transcriptional regulator